MLSVNIIATLDSKNVSVDTGMTKKRFEDIWNSADNSMKNKAVSLGGYKDTRAFTNAKNSGQISVRMIVALSLTFNVNPFWLSAEVSTKGECTEEALNEFLKKSGFEQFCTDKKDSNVREELKIFSVNTITNLDDSILDRALQLSEEECMTLLKALLIKSKDTKDYRMELIKIMLYC